MYKLHKKIFRCKVIILKPTYTSQRSFTSLLRETLSLFSRYFCNDTSLHGWSYIPRFSGAGRVGWLHRILWILVRILKAQIFLAK